MGGIGLADLFIEQGTAKVQCLLQEVRQQTSLGKLLVNQLQRAQQVAGMDTPILQDPKRAIPQLESER